LLLVFCHCLIGQYTVKSVSYLLEVMGNVSRVEPDDCILVDSDDTLRQKLQKVGWLNFIKKFHGYNLEVAKQFAATFDGKKAVVGNLEL